jgi:histidine triad (HIT) family protein
MTDCVFCRIALGQIPAHIVYQDADVVAFRDSQPQAPVHVLIVPREHVTGFRDVPPEQEGLIGKVARAAVRVAEQEGVAGSGFRCVVNSGSDAQQSVMHLHMHVLGGRQMTWPPG